MNRSPDRLNLDHLKKQAKDLIRLYRSRDPAAMARFRAALPAAAGHSDEDISSLQLRLHDAQSCIAREHGFASWPDLKRYVEVQMATRSERSARVLHWAQLLYSGDVSGTVNRANPRVALRMLADDPAIVADDPWLACAIGDEAALRQATRADPSWVNRTGGPLRLPPLFAVAHSSLLRVDEFRERLHRLRAVAHRSWRRRQPAHFQPLAAGIARTAGPALSALDALWRGRQQSRSCPDRIVARRRREPQRWRIALSLPGKSGMHASAAGARRAYRRKQCDLPRDRSRGRCSAEIAAGTRRRSE